MDEQLYFHALTPEHRDDFVTVVETSGAQSHCGKLKRLSLKKVGR